MKNTRALCVTLLGACVFGLGASGPGLSSQPMQANAVGIGMPLDWSEQSLVFAAATADEAAAKGNSARWTRLAGDPRYVLQLMRRFETEAARGMAVKSSMGARSDRGRDRGRDTPDAASAGIYRDWSHVLGGADGGRGETGIYPAKYSFDIAATPNCANDFVVYTTSTAAASSSGTAASRVGTMLSANDPSGSITIGTGARAVVLTAATNNTGKNFNVAGDNAAEAASLAAAVNRWSFQTGIVATSASDATILFKRNSGGASGTVPITDALSNFSLPLRVNGNGTTGQPTVIAFNQLYNTTCNAGRSNIEAPNTYWAYNTGNGRVAETSPTISYYDGGKQVAFVQRNPAPTPDQLELVLLKWATGAGNGSAGEPVTPTAVTPANYKACTAPCMTVIAFSGTSNTNDAKTYSAPFVDYGADILWVGDGNSRLHKFVNVFRGTTTPAEVTSGGYPVALSTTTNGLKVSSPVYDFAGNVFIGGGGDGRLYRVNVAAAPAVFASNRLTAGSYASGLRAGAVVDSGAQRVYAFLFNDGSSACGGGSCEAVVQFPTNFTAGSGVSARVGSGQNVVDAVMHRGRFDSAYYASPANSRTGAMYVCGTGATDAFQVRLWKIRFINGVMQTPQMGPQLGPNVNGSCSPATVFKNGSNEYLYASVPDGSTSNGCTGACLFMFNLSNLNGTGAVWAASNVPTATLPVFGGTTGIIVDNISNLPGTSQVYFSHLATPGNAIQASQGGLL
ncbi:MAG: hypothetical protein EOP38_05230 [Rubrivivax sp.]|nr:MAG: hypothetical protein EOP38_05230 [Rubrivivax sp.]